MTVTMDMDLDTAGDIDTPVAAFKRLQTTHQRQAALQALVRELSPYEWRLLHAATAVRLFQFDIIGTLPIELVAQIFSYLDTSAPYRLQRVSKSWHQLLMSLDILKKSLASWYGGVSSLQAADYNFCQRKAQSAYAYRRGRKPDSCLLFTPNTSTDNNRPALLVGHTLILQTNTEQNTISRPRSLSLFNIRAWTCTSLSGEAREEIRQVFASTQLVACTTFTPRCYVFDLATLERRKFCLPNASTTPAVSCRERTVAYAMVMSESILVTTWDYDTQRSTSFTIPLKSGPSTNGLRFGLEKRLAILVQPKKSRVIVFTTRPRDPKVPDGAPSICHNIYSYHGDCISHDSTPLDGAIRVEIPPVLNCLVPTDNRGTLRLDLKSKTLSGSNASWTEIGVQFDEDLNTFIRIDDLAIRECESDCVGQRHLKCECECRREGRFWIDVVSTFWWKDVFFEEDYKAVRVAYEPECHASWIFGASKPRLSLVFSEGNGNPLANDTYVIYRTDTGCYILCYDHEVKFPKDDGSFPAVGSWKKVTCFDQPIPR